MDLIITLVLFVVGLCISYFLIKSAVRNGVIEAIMRLKEPPMAKKENSISQTTCPSCGKQFDCDYPKCPFCEEPNL